MPVLATAALTISLIVSGLIRVERGFPVFVSLRSNGPVVISAVRCQCLIAATGQRPGVMEEGSTTSSSLIPVWFVFDRGM